jgi:hypothetical protein
MVCGVHIKGHLCLCIKLSYLCQYVYCPAQFCGSLLYQIARKSVALLVGHMEKSIYIRYLNLAYLWINNLYIKIGISPRVFFLLWTSQILNFNKICKLAIWSTQ